MASNLLKKLGFYIGFLIIPCMDYMAQTFVFSHAKKSYDLLIFQLPVCGRNEYNY